MQILFATNNARKVEEVRAILANTDIEVLPLAAAGLDMDPPETGDTFEANALQKARFVHAHTGKPVIADDSGIAVDALDGAPGVHSKRYSAEATAEANNAKLLDALSGVAARGARFVCVLAYVGSDGERTVRGEVEGHIAERASGTEGFGYDPLFVPDAYPDRTMAELSMAEKNAISHRGRAFHRLPELLAGP